MSITTPIVLEEEIYTLALSKIIQRDFFPHLEDLNEEEEDDLLLLRGVQWHDLTLDQFQAVYTSEDNASFGEMLKAAQKKQRERLEQMFGEQAFRKRIAAGLPEDVLLSLRLGQGQDKERYLLQKSLDEPLEKESREISQALTLLKPDSTKATTNPFKHKIQNTLMFYPEGVKPSSEDIRAAPKIILKGNTRLDSANLSSSFAVNTRTMSILASSENETNYNLVASTPLIKPGDLDEPILTWGQLESTPVVLSQQPTARAFKLPPTPRRELIAGQLADRASRELRKRQFTPSRTTGAGRRKRDHEPSTPRLSDAARSLLDRHDPRLIQGMDLKLRASYQSPFSTRESSGIGIKTPLRLSTLEQQNVGMGLDGGRGNGKKLDPVDE